MKCFTGLVLLLLLAASTPVLGEESGLPGVGIPDGPSVDCQEPAERCSVSVFRTCFDVVWFERYVAGYHVWGTGCTVIIENQREP